MLVASGDANCRIGYIKKVASRGGLAVVGWGNRYKEIPDFTCIIS